MSFLLLETGDRILQESGFSIILDAVAGNELSIDGEERDILQQWSISEQLNERGTMRFGVKSMDASYRPGLREVVNFNWIGIHFFAGHIHHADEGGLGGYGVVPIVTQCGATDFNALLDRRQVEITLPSGTLKSQMELIAPYLVPFGTVIDPAQVNGPMMPELVFTMGTLKALTDKLSVASGYASNINYDNVWSMFEPGIVAAPFNIEDNDARVIGDVRVSPTTVEYGNYIIVKWTVPAIAAYAFFELADVPTEDETVTIGSTVYVWKAAPGAAPEVQIGGDIAASIDNLIAAIFPSHPEVDAFEQASDSIRVTAISAGVAGNGIQVSTTCVDGEWITEGGGQVSHLNFGADAALTGQVIAQNIPAQDGGANLHEKTYEEPTATSEATAQALADGYLVRSLVQPREVRYRTRLHGLRPGMQQQIQVTGRNVDGPCLITAVDISPEGSAKYNYDVTAVEGLIIVPSYQDGWRTLAGRVA